MIPSHTINQKSLDIHFYSRNTLQKKSCQSLLRPFKDWKRSRTTRFFKFTLSKTHIQPFNLIFIAFFLLFVWHESQIYCSSGHFFRNLLLNSLSNRTRFLTSTVFGYHTFLLVFVYHGVQFEFQGSYLRKIRLWSSLCQKQFISVDIQKSQRLTHILLVTAQFQIIKFRYFFFFPQFLKLFLFFFLISLFFQNHFLFSQAFGPHSFASIISTQHTHCDDLIIFFFVVVSRENTTGEIKIIFSFLFWFWFFSLDKLENKLQLLELLFRVIMQIPIFRQCLFEFNSSSFPSLLIVKYYFFLVSNTIKLTYFSQINKDFNSWVLYIPFLYDQFLYFLINDNRFLFGIKRFKKILTTYSIRIIIFFDNFYILTVELTFLNRNQAMKASIVRCHDKFVMEKHQVCAFDFRKRFHYEVYSIFFYG